MRRDRASAYRTISKLKKLMKTFVEVLRNIREIPKNRKTTKGKDK